MRIIEKIKEIEAEMARTQKNKATGYAAPTDSSNYRSAKVLFSTEMFAMGVNAPARTVPALEHNNVVIGDSLDVVKYIDSNFEGPSLLPNDPAKREFVEELLAYTDKFVGGGALAALPRGMVGTVPATGGNSSNGAIPRGKWPNAQINQPSLFVGADDLQRLRILFDRQLKLVSNRQQSEWSRLKDDGNEDGVRRNVERNAECHE
ncbi:hypothetical protein Syun_020968 [Stephania yunnanensis]|uniref:GST N-terminal domain-containing protein n=1 Tax=Stephania yunnanensis TaxID=152371 RepID=A0AAP0IEW4_9MAGN